MNYLSICSGIEAASVAWQPLGMRAAAFAEIDPFASAVLEHRYPGVRNLGDFTRITADDVGAVDILVGGTPCQSFSIAGLRGGLADDRGNLALQFLKLAQRVRPRWLVWENVPGVLSSNGGRDFGAILGGMVECGYGFAYRVLDAQYFGLAQRRKRVFVVGYLGDWRRAAAVLFEREGLSWNPPPRGKARKEVAGTLGSRSSAGGGLGTDFECDGGIVPTVSTGGRGLGDFELGGGLAHTLNAKGGSVSEDGTGRGIPIIPIQSVQAVREKKQNGIGIGQDGDAMFTVTARDRHAIAFDTTQITSKTNRSRPNAGDPCHPLASGAHAPAIAFSCKDRGSDAGDLAPTLRAMEHSGSRPNAGGQVAIAYRTTGNDGCYELGDQAGCLNTQTDPNAQVVAFPGSTVRRLTPRECERLQGFPDDYTQIPYRGKSAADAPRYRALGNSMAVPVMAWIGKGLLQAEAS